MSLLSGSRLWFGRSERKLSLPASEMWVTVKHKKVSKEHASLELSRDGALILTDRSTNGTFVNGARAQNGATLVHGDVLSFALRDAELGLPRYRVEMDSNSSCSPAAGRTSSAVKTS